jgi:hypothetical protein
MAKSKSHRERAWQLQALPQNQEFEETLEVERVCSNVTSNKITIMLNVQ